MPAARVLPSGANARGNRGSAVVHFRVTLPVAASRNCASGWIHRCAPSLPFIHRCGQFLTKVRTFLGGSPTGLAVSSSLELRTGHSPWAFSNGGLALRTPPQVFSASRANGEHVLFADQSVRADFVVGRGVGWHSAGCCGVDSR